ncbi:membrane protein [Tenacibaculum holothuriorum]|uniref:Membrane protein n=1 Tax=Tenacibaculum holothuriorum TaxID=1635173 RepID=A0A1Y2PE84_9FLAO|nr:sulfite exporter TauE/SafE family protein [Tenacibaculum holothuriorum]OSY87988.1 membrane protein [Tenacibaculum holothuriorum]
MLFSALIFGLLGSFHCVGMCGPIAFMLPVNRHNKVQQFFQITSYHFGRLFTYATIGLLFGLLGKGFNFFGFQQQISIFVGVLMIVSIVIPQLFAKLKVTNSLSKLVIKVKSSLGKELQRKDNNTFFTLGFLNGLLPCGLVYMAVFGAITSTNISSAILYMVLFGLGTIPLMTSVVYVGNFTNGLLRNKIQKAIPYVVVFIGVLFILRGLGLDIPYISPMPITDTVGEVNSCH